MLVQIISGILTSFTRKEVHTKRTFPIYRIGTRFKKNGMNIAGDVGIITDHESYYGILPRAGVE